jgi:hypothetical protein
MFPAVGKGVGMVFVVSQTRNEFERCPIRSSPESFRGCRALALAKADRYEPKDTLAASYDSACQPSKKRCRNLFTFTSYRAMQTRIAFTLVAHAI